MKTSKFKLIGIATLAFAPLAAFAAPPDRAMSEAAAVAYDQRPEPYAAYTSVHQSWLNAQSRENADSFHAYSLGNPENPDVPE
jgi:hypothetical protein